MSYNKNFGIVGKISKSAYIFHYLVFKNSPKKVKKIEEEILLLLIERCHENDFYINRKLNNRRVQKYKNFIENIQSQVIILYVEVLRYFILFLNAIFLKIRGFSSLFFCFLKWIKAKLIDIKLNTIKQVCFYLITLKKYSVTAGSQRNNFRMAFQNLV